MDMSNIILNTDSYKTSHYEQYPEGTTMVNSYIEARGSVSPDVKKTVFFGLQMFIKEYLTRPVTHADVSEAKEIFGLHGVPFNEDGWRYIVDKLGGKLPVEIEAVPEGSVVDLQNVLVQVRNTDPNVPWLTSYLETALLRAVWYPTTVATNSWMIRQELEAYARKSGSSADVSFKLHDFGSRGVSSKESAGIGGLAHLVNFMGTDTVEAVVAGRKYYNEAMAGFSIPATEHSTITVWGENEEDKAYANMLNKFARPGSVLACVSDSYDIYHATENLWGGKLRQQIEESGATLVVRPDSGDPTTVPIEIIDILMMKFGYTINSAGYKVLPDCIRVIQGDGIDINSIRQILANMDKRKFALDNIAFGMGGALLQHMNRDTLKFAMKASAARINGEPRDVYKRPVGDTGKSSKRGILVLEKGSNGKYFTRQRWDASGKNELQTVYRNGELLIDQSLGEIRERAAKKSDVPEWHPQRSNEEVAS
jgi:nicotinamide phosphoribosyltransferase